MIRFLDRNGNHVDVAVIECTSDGARRLSAALNASTTTVPYSTIKLRGLAVRVVTSKAAAPKPKHVAAFPDSDLGSGVER